MKNIVIVEKYQKRLIACFFALLLLIGLATVPSYGVPSDEPREFQTLYLCQREYVRLLLGTDPEFERYFEKVGLLEPNFQNYGDRDYGMALFYPIAPFLLIGTISVQFQTLIWHAYIFLLFLLGCWALYSICLRLFHSRALACVGTLFLYLSPRIFAEGHYNSKDTMIMVLVFIMLWQCLRLMETATFPRGLLFALSGALAANQRVIGLFLFGLIALFVLIHHLIQKNLTLRTILTGVAVLVSFLGLYYILTPNAWGQPWMNLPATFATFSNFNRWNGVALFQGISYHPAVSPLPRYYLFVFMAITTPLFLLAFISVGQIFVVQAALASAKKRLDEPKPNLLFLLLCSLLWLVPMAYFFLRQPVVYDGWRHFEFVYAPLLILAVYGVYRLGRLLRQKWLKGLGILALCGCLLFTAVGMAQNHPFQYAYFNILAGDAEELYDSDYWFLSAYDALNTLLTSSSRNKALPLTVKGINGFRLNALAVSKRRAFTLIPEEDSETVPSYLLVNPSRERARRGQEGYADYVNSLTRDYHVLFDLKSYDHVIMVIWERNQPVAAISSPET